MIKSLSISKELFYSILSLLTLIPSLSMAFNQLIFKFEFKMILPLSIDATDFIQLCFKKFL